MPEAERTGQEAIDYTLNRVGTQMPESGLCLQFTRQDFAIPSLYASAIDAWNAAHDQHPNDRNPPPAVPVWFWSSSIYRHVAFHLGDGVVTTFNADIRRMGSLEEMEQTFGPFMGWASDLNDHFVNPPVDLGEDMPTAQEFWAAAPEASYSMSAPMMMTFVGVDHIWMCDLARLTRVRITDINAANFFGIIGIRRIDNQPLGHVFKDITEDR